MLHFIRTLRQSVRRAGQTLSGARRRRSRHNIDALEPRTLLASLVSATKLMYQDIDGDNVTVTLSKPVLTAGNVNSIFTFNTSNVDGSTATKQNLRTINLVGVAGVAGTTITTAAVKSATNGGDGFATLGQINATGLDIGAVTIDGDLVRILAGDATLTTQGLGALKVHSMGRYGLQSGALNFHSVIQGKLASLTTKSDIKDANIDVQGGTNGQIGSITIGGSLIGGAFTNSGRIESSGNMGAVKVTENVIGGSGQFTGYVHSAGKIVSVTIAGSLIGGAGSGSGTLHGGVELGAVNVTGDVIGGAGIGSGSVYADDKLTSVTIGGSLIGGTGLSSGLVYSGLDMGAVTVKGSILGGQAAGSDVNEATGAVITRSKLASLTVGGSIRGGAGDFSGIVYSDLDMGPVKVTGDVAGGLGEANGVIGSQGNLASVAIGGSLVGGNRSGSGGISVREELASLEIGGNIRGGSASGADDLEGSGFVLAGRIGTLTLKGSLIAGTNTTSGTYRNNGAIRVFDNIANLKIMGSVFGNSTNSAVITARGQKTPSGSTDLAIGKLTINGRVEYGLIVAGSMPVLAITNANADAQIGPVVIGGDWIASSLVAGAAAGLDGQYGTSDDVKMSGAGVMDAPNVSSKITSIVIGGQVIGTPSILNNHYGFVAENIGSFKVKGGTTTYTLIAGNSNDDILLAIPLSLFLGGDIRLNEI